MRNARPRAGQKVRGGSVASGSGRGMRQLRDRGKRLHTTWLSVGCLPQRYGQSRDGPGRVEQIRSVRQLLPSAGGPETEAYREFRDVTFEDMIIIVL